MTPLRRRLLLPVIRQTRPIAFTPRVCNYTTGAPATPKKYNFTSISSLVQSPSAKTVLVDVREPSEFSAGAIPGAINLPIASAPDALSLPPDEFEDRFGFQKPEKSSELVFYCKAGIRSAAAARLALQEGYEHVGEYPGSWMDWVKEGK
ncbi:Rhodanese-like domain-containing protein [Tricharina praecox]|uniref:Rhodanese-like domain-containing protein n=1 Tax=Tricharina praecox TaxID=43433 RepID=UPI00221FED13|nr:Rhodanese-like domain-containing protein [Tricharina praecox]KAI5854258.1 Rhodanese-like domain-containing protein [Tricharina praecox]